MNQRPLPPAKQPPTHAATHYQTVEAKPLTVTVPTKDRVAGRPSKLVMPELPKMPMSDVEQALFDFFMEAYKQEYPDLIPTDMLTLYLAGLEFVKYLRIIAEELETGHVLTMSRQHPGVNMRALLDQLSVTRKARQARNVAEVDEGAKELKEFFMSMGRKVS
jgi:hypothetical protein